MDGKSFLDYFIFYRLFLFWGRKITFGDGNNFLDYFNFWSFFSVGPENDYTVESSPPLDCLRVILTLVAHRVPELFSWVPWQHLATPLNNRPGVNGGYGFRLADAFSILDRHSLWPGIH